MSMSPCFIFLLLSSISALKISISDTPDSDTMELWNRTAFTIFGPYWAQHNDAQRGLMLRQLLATDFAQMSNNLPQKMTLLHAEKVRRLHLKETTGHEVIPGCSSGEHCSAKSYLQAVLRDTQLTGSPTDQPTASFNIDDDCTEIVWGDCLQQELSSGMTLHFNADTDLFPLDTKMIVGSKRDGSQGNWWSPYIAVPADQIPMIHESHSLLQMSQRDHGTCPQKAAGWCRKNGWHGDHADALSFIQGVIAPAVLDTIFIPTLEDGQSVDGGSSRRLGEPFPRAL